MHEQLESSPYSLRAVRGRSRGRTRVPHQRHIGRVFVIRGADDAGLTVRTAEGVTDVELLQAEDVPPPAGEVGHRGGTHAAEAENDRVVGHRLPFTFCVGSLFGSAVGIPGVAHASAIRQIVPLRRRGRNRAGAASRRPPSSAPSTSATRSARKSNAVRFSGSASMIASNSAIAADHRSSRMCPIAQKNGCGSHHSRTCHSRSSGSRTASVRASERKSQTSELLAT